MCATVEGTKAAPSSIDSGASAMVSTTQNISANLMIGQRQMKKGISLAFADGDATKVR